MGTEGTMVTWNDVQPVLNALANVEAIRTIHVVGSIARDNRGHDLDVVVSVSMFTYINYLKMMWAGCEQCGAYQYDPYYDLRETRYHAALDAIKMSKAELGWLMSSINALRVNVDIHVMPEGWQGNVDELQTHLSHNDPQFVAHIAGDARRVNTVEDERGVKQAWNLLPVTV